MAEFLQKLFRARPTPLRAAVLVLFGLAVGYPAWQVLGRAMWGALGANGPSAIVALLAFLIAGVAFLAGVGSFVIVSVEAVTSPSATVRGDFPSTPLALQLLAAAIVVLGIAERAASKGAPFGRYYWQFNMYPALVALVPIIVAIVLMRKRANPTGLALLFVAAALEAKTNIVWWKFAGVFVGDIWIDLNLILGRLSENPLIDLHLALTLATMLYVVWLWWQFRIAAPNIRLFASVLIVLAFYYKLTWSLLDSILPPG
jgi:hypothetical protein